MKKKLNRSEKKLQRLLKDKSIDEVLKLFVQAGIAIIVADHVSRTVAKTIKETDRNARKLK